MVGFPEDCRAGRRWPRVLVVDDSLTARAVLRAYLARLGCEVLTASTVAEGLARLDVGPDLVVLDLWLPDGDGEAVLRRVRLRNLPTRVAVVTGLGDLHRLRRVLDLEPDLLLRKPINPSHLRRLLDPCPA